MPKISGLIPVQNIASDDELPIRDVSAQSTRRMTLAAFKAWLQSLTGWITSTMIGAAQVKFSNLDGATMPIVHVYSDTASYALSGTNILKVSGAVINSVPTAFTVDTVNRRIVIGQGVTRVKVSFNIMCDATTSAYIYARIRKNAVELTQIIQERVSQFVGAASPNKVIDVVAGDYIDINMDFNGNIRGNFSYITIEAIKG